MTGARKRERSTDEEPRWPASLAVIAALVLFVTLPERLNLGPRWLIPALEAALLVAVTLRAPRRHPKEGPRIRAMSILLIALVNLANALALGKLVQLVIARHEVSGRTLIFSGVQIWLTLIIVFALWYWEIDRGGPGHRASAPPTKADFAFTQMTNRDLARPDWRPNFLDYLYLSFTNATAFSPTDTLPLSLGAKALMAAEALASIITVVIVAARAVNVL